MVHLFISIWIFNAVHPSTRDYGNWGDQVDKAVKSVNSVISYIKNSFTYFDAEEKFLYVALRI